MRVLPGETSLLSLQVACKHTKSAQKYAEETRHADRAVDSNQFTAPLCLFFPLQLSFVETCHVLPVHMKTPSSLFWIKYITKPGRTDTLQVLLVRGVLVGNRIKSDLQAFLPLVPLLGVGVF